MGRKTHGKTAKDFVDPLLAVLLHLSNGQSEVAVPFRNTWDPICTVAGVTLDQYGQDSDGKNWVSQWIGHAFRELKRKKLGLQKGRGRWALTADGVQAAKAAGSYTPPVAAPPMAAVDDDSKPEPDTILPPVTGVSLAIGPSSATDNYHDDPYIRALAVSLTKCYGLHSAKSPICKTCPLQHSCRGKVAGLLSALAAELEAQDLAAIAAAAAPSPTPTETTDDSVRDDNVPDGGWDNSRAEPIICRVGGGVCYRCNDVIVENEPCFWIRDDTSTGDKGGLYHPGCE